MSEKFSSGASNKIVASENDRLAHNGSNGTRKAITTNGMSWIFI